MFDLWYATGAAIMFPEIFDEVVSGGNAAGVAAGRAAGAPLFYHVPAIQFCDDQRVPVVNPNNPAPGNAPLITDSGFIVADIIDDVRVAIKDAVHSRFAFAPPISLYTAGKFCQILTVPAYNLRTNISLANQGYQTVVKNLPTKRSPNFPAFLGVFLMDPGLTASLSGAVGATTTAQNALAEFQITDPGEISAFQNLAKPGDFMTAQSNLLGNVAGPPTWTTCREQIVGWSPRTDGMVI
jgi:hypothetical protein